MAIIIPLNNITYLDLDPDQVLKNIIGKLNSVVVLGYDLEGDEFFASSIADGADVCWLMERCKKQLLETDEG